MPGIRIAEIKKVIREFGKEYPAGTKLRFCVVCLGANFTGQKDIPGGGWVCGAWQDGGGNWLLGICENFRLDKKLLRQVTRELRERAAVARANGQCVVSNAA